MMLADGAFGYLGDFSVWLVLFASILFNTYFFFRFFPKTKYPKRSLILGNGLIFVCLLGFAGLIGESYFRFVCVETDPFGWSLPAQRWFALYTRLNSRGCRDVEWTQEKPSGVHRVALVGDSFTYGWGIEQVEDRFSQRLQERFDRRGGGRVEVMNVAKPGWSTDKELYPIQDLIATYGVDEVVLCYVANDIEFLLPRSEEFNPIEPPLPVWFNPDSSCLLEYLFRRLSAVRAPTVSGYHDWLADGFANQEILARHHAQLTQIIQTCRSSGVTLRVALMPFIRTAGDKFNTKKIHDGLRRFFESNQVPVVDLSPTIADLAPSTLTVNSHDSHPNELANERFALGIWDAFYAESSP